jgi:IclR family KDG regulon transcriptional repressor
MKSKVFTSLEKAIDILNLYDVGGYEYTAQEISNKLGIPLSTTYKYLDVLVKRQLLARNSKSKKFRLGMMIFRLGNVISKDFSLINVAMPYLKKLTQKTGETSILTNIEGYDSVCLERVEPDCLIKFSLKPGRKLPLYVGATSKILLAYQEDSFIDAYLDECELIKLTNKTINDKRILKDSLQKIRQDGYACSHSEADSGATAVAAPIFNENGKILAGLSIAGPAERINEDKLLEFRDFVKESAKNISTVFGYHYTF